MTSWSSAAGRQAMPRHGPRAMQALMWRLWIRARSGGSVFCVAACRQRPSCALPRSRPFRRAKEFGLSPVSAHADLSAIVDRKDRLVREFADYRIQQLQDPRFTLYRSQTVFRFPREMPRDTVLSAASFIIATGSRPSEVSIPGLVQAGYLTSDTILDVRTQPDSLLVLGGGAVALEIGQFFARLGTKVTILQRGRTLLLEMDEDVGRALEAALIDEGIEVVTGTQWLRVTRDTAEKTVWVVKDGRERSYVGQEILQALGRQPNIEGLRLDLADVTVDSGRIVVDGAMRTSQAHIYAVGDVNDVRPLCILPSSRAKLPRTTRHIQIPRQRRSIIASIRK